MRFAAAAAFIFLLSVSPAGAGTSVVDSLAARGRLGIPIEKARLLEEELGQLFIINVDGFGYSGPLALEPDFPPLVERLQVGGVIPHYGSSDYEKVRRTNRALSGMTKLPLLVCADIVRLRARAPAPGGKAPGGKAPGGKALRSASFGDGYVGGFIGHYRALPDAEFGTLARLNAFTFAALGINIALGPTVDDSTRDARTADRARVVISALRRFGLLPVIKHFPFLPSGANLHHESPDTRVPEPRVEQRVETFRELAGLSPIMMTTHLDDSLVDSRIVTFSPVWISLLRRLTGFSGLLTSDGLFMLRAYKNAPGLRDADDPAAAGLAAEGLAPTAVWAVRAIMAGHDFVIVEGSARQTQSVFNGVLAAACSGSPAGSALAARIEESWSRIRAFKEANEAVLRRQIDVPRGVMDSVVELVPPEGADLSRFRFDASKLRTVETVMAADALEGGPQ